MPRKRPNPNSSCASPPPGPLMFSTSSMNADIWARTSSRFDVIASAAHIAADANRFAQGFAPRHGNILLKRIHPSLQNRQVSSLATGRDSAPAVQPLVGSLRGRNPPARSRQTSMFLDLRLEIRYRGPAPNRKTRPGLLRDSAGLAELEALQKNANSTSGLDHNSSLSAS